MLDAYAARRTSSLSFFVAPAATLSNPYDTAIQLKRDGRYASDKDRECARWRGWGACAAGPAGVPRRDQSWPAVPEAKDFREGGRAAFSAGPLSLYLHLSVPSSPLLSPPIYNADWPRPRMHDPALPPRALSRSAASTSTSTTADRRVTEEPLPFRGSTSSILARAR